MAKIPWHFFQNSLTIPWPGENFVFPWLFPDTWQPCYAPLRNLLVKSGVRFMWNPVFVYCPSADPLTVPYTIHFYCYFILTIENQHRSFWIMQCFKLGGPETPRTWVWPFSVHYWLTTLFWPQDDCMFLTRGATISKTNLAFEGRITPPVLLLWQLGMRLQIRCNIPNKCDEFQTTNAHWSNASTHRLQVQNLSKFYTSDGTSRD